MKVYIGPYKNWFGPHQLAQLLCFWVKDVTHKDSIGDRIGYEYKDKPDWVFKLGEWLAYGKWRGADELQPKDKDGIKVLFREEEEETKLYKFLLWIDKKRKRTSYIKIDKYDTWSMDHTLALIILPMLKQLKDTKHGSPLVDMEDVPDYMRTTSTEDYDAQLTFDFYHQDEKKYKYDIHDRWDWALSEMIWAFEQLTDDESEQKFYKNGEWDMASYEEFNSRKKRGLTLFGKYYQGLWD